MDEMIFKKLWMSPGIRNWFSTKYPQNYIIKNPLKGALIINLFIFCFAALYKPLNTHAAGALSYDTTMAFYCFLSGVFLYVSLKILKTISFFSNSNDWSILKEFISVIIVLFLLGIAIYFLGFLIEPSGQRWNVPTLLNSFKGAFLAGIIPLAFFTAINYRFLFWQSVIYKDENNMSSEPEKQQKESLIRISSQLKKEELSFYPSQFIYAESEGNYVVFYLSQNGVIKKEVIRNSINSIEQQLADIPYFLRTHRAFIVNLKKVTGKQGNTLGYMIKLSGNESRIPVSRKNTRIFNTHLTQYHN
jgi:hypothetical protein